jgi:cytidine deaminase
VFSEVGVLGISMEEFTKDEQRLVDFAKQILEKHIVINPDDGMPNPGAFVISERGNIYHGVAFDGISDGMLPVHAEVVAIATMCTEEGLNAKVKTLLIMAGSDDRPNIPCGACRHTIYVTGSEDPVVLGGNLSLTKIRKYRLSELYPYAYDELY